MGWLKRLRFASRVASQPAPAKPRVLFSWQPGPFLPGGKYVGTLGNTTRVTRAEALSVVGVKRGRDLLCSIASLPLEQVGPDRVRVRSPLLEQIDPSVPNVVTMAMTVEDLIFDSVSWWRVTRYGWDGFPVEARHVDLSAVSMSPPPGYPMHTLPSGMFPDGVVWVNGAPVSGSDMIRFDSPNGPLLEHGARAVRRALKLAQAAEMYCDDPQARGYFSPAEGADPASDTVITELLDEWADARRTRDTAYVPASLTYNPLQVSSPADLQLVQLQQRSDLEIANLMQLDPEDLGISTTTRTYANATDRRQDRLNNTFAPYMRAITDRLSLGDVTRRGYRVRFNLDDYLKADPATRWATYGIALDKGVKSIVEVRGEEDLPSIPVEARPAPAPAPTPQGGTVPTQNAAPVSLTFAVEASSFVFEDGGSAEQFRASTARRTVSGVLLPFGPVGRNGSGRWRFAPGSVEWNRSAVSRVKLNREHDRAQLLGAATEVRETDGGVFAAFKVARGGEGDAALNLAEDGALDGLSAEVDVLDYTTDPVDPDVFLVTKARLTGGALTSSPAFDDARVTSVAASAHMKGTTMTDATGQTAPDAPAAAPDTAAFTAAVDAFTAAVRALGAMPAEQRRTINPVPFGDGVKAEPLVYSLTGMGDSFVRDAWDARHAQYGSKDAEEAVARLRKYGEQTADLAARSAQRFANAGNTTDQAEIIPAGYRPDLYVGQVPQGRPLFDSIGTRVTLANATSFKVPVWVGSAGLNGTNTEGTGPSTGTITDHTYRTVSPTAQSGEFVITRELMDSSNPAIDVIALNAMREEYAQDTEAVIATALAAATDNDTGAGQSTEGCYVYSVTGTGNDLYTEGIRLVEGEYPAHRFLTPDRMLAGPTGYSALVRAVDDVGRPMFPFLAPANAGGTVGRAAGTLNVDGLAVPNAWSMTSTYNDVVSFTSTDMLVGESPLLTFRFEEKGGPENIYLNIWGYFCFQILRYTGVHAINYTAV